MISEFLSSTLRITTNIVLIICILGTSINIFKCLKKYFITMKQINSNKQSHIDISNLKGLTKEEYFLWIFKFLDAYDYVDYEYTLSLGEFKNIKEDFIIGNKNNIPVFIKIMPSTTIDVSLSSTRKFIGEMLANNCSVGILVSDHPLTESAKEFISSASLNNKITILPLDQVCKLHNCLDNFPTTLA